MNPVSYYQNEDGSTTPDEEMEVVLPKLDDKILSAFNGYLKCNKHFVDNEEKYR